MNLSSNFGGTTSCLESTLLYNIAQSTGQSNSEIPSWDTEIAIREALPRINEELDDLDQAIAKLKAKRSKIVDLVHSLEVARAPHKRLPLDVLTYIFSLVAEGSKLSTSTVRTYPPWVIRSVCSHWRKVALEQRTLWSAIVLQPKSLLHRNARVIDWDKEITRALSILPSETDVSITLLMDPSANSLIDDAFKKLILPLSPRLHTLAFTGSGPRAFENLFRMSSPTSFPALATLKLFLSWGMEGPLDFGGDPSPVIDTELGSEPCLLSSAPNLRSLDIIWQSSTRFEELLQGLQNRVSWAKLTHLRIKSIDHNTMDYDHILPALTVATNLRHLSLNLDGDLDNMPENQDNITFPHLQHFHVKALTLHGIFDFLVLPSLQSLIVEGVINDGLLRSISTMIARSSCSLVSFKEQSDRRRQTTTALFTEFVSRCENLEELETDREITPHLLYKVAAQEMLGRCSFQRWKIPSELSSEAVVSTIGDGLKAHPDLEREKPTCRVLVLEAKDSREAKAIQTLSSRFRSEYGLEVRSYGGPMSIMPPPSFMRMPRTSNASSTIDLFSSDFINSVASSLDEFDSGGLFRPDGDINFERDFAQWFNPDDVNGLDMK